MMVFERSETSCIKLCIDPSRIDVFGLLARFGCRLTAIRSDGRGKQRFDACSFESYSSREVTVGNSGSLL